MCKADMKTDKIRRKYWDKCYEGKCVRWAHTTFLYLLARWLIWWVNLGRLTRQPAFNLLFKLTLGVKSDFKGQKFSSDYNGQNPEHIWYQVLVRTGATESLIHCWWACKMVQPFWKTVWWFPTKLNIHLTYDLTLCSLVFTHRSWQFISTQKPARGCL